MVMSLWFKFSSQHKNDYCIPMTISEILEKLIKGKKIQYNKKIKNTLFVQKFTKNYKKYSYRTEDFLIPKKIYEIFLSNHATNLSINNLPINIFIKKYSNNINVYNSGAIREYLPGPISQNLIFNAAVN